MPDPATPVVIQDPAAIAAHNAAIVQKVAAQDASGQSTATNRDFADTTAALDTLAKAAEEAAKAKEGATTPAVVPPAAEDEAAKKAAEEAAAKKAAEEAAAAAVTPPPVDEDIFKTAPSLPQGASVKSTEAFATIKEIARTEIARARQEAETAKAELEAAKKAAAEKTPEQVQREAELKELKEWRAKIDVQFDPQFKQFDQKINTSREFIYSLLRRSPVVTDETIKAIKAAGGPERINIEVLFEKINDPGLKRLVESKVADIFQTDHEKAQAIETAKSNVSDYLKQRETAFTQMVGEHNAATKANVDALLKQFDWFAPKTASATADAAEKAKIEDHNKFIEKLTPELEAAARDDSAIMRATLIAGTAKLFYLQREHKAITARAESAEKQVAALTEKIAKIQKASTSRLRDTNAPANGTPAPVKPADVFNTHATDSLDSLMKGVMEKRAAAAQ